MKTYRAGIPDYHDDDPKGWWDIQAHDAEDAAEKTAERYDNDGDYPMGDEGNCVVKVMSPEGDITTWTVESSVIKIYRACDQLT